MDAWIKGIRRLTVIYYNHVPPEVARELLEAGAITDIRVRVGIEYCAPLRGRFVRFIWTPRGIADPSEFLDFLELPDTAQLMAEGREVSQYQQRYVLAALDESTPGTCPRSTPSSAWTWRPRPAKPWRPWSARAKPRCTTWPS
jgi:hypothetical protein